MDLPKYGDNRDLWSQSLPVKRIVQIIMESLTDSAKNNSLPDIQIIIVGKFILSTVIDLQEFNQLCQSNHSEDMIEGTECQQYLSLFDKIFQSILDTKDSISKEEIMDLVWKYYNEGTIDFSSTSIPQLLMKSMSPDILQEKLIDAMSNTDDHIKLKYMVSSVSSPTNFSVIMNTLFTMFTKSHYHSRIMDFTQFFVSSIREQYSLEYFKLFPTYFVPLLLVYDFLYVSNKILAKTTHRNTNTTSQKCECFILRIVDDMYNPKNINKYTSYNQMDQRFLSFYIASSCPQLLQTMSLTLQNGQLSFSLYPHLWTFIKHDS